MVLCTQSDVETRLQVDFTNPDEPVVADLIAAATGLIQDHCDQHLESQDGLSVKLDGSGTAWLLPHEIPIRAVNSVTEDGSALTEGDDYLWYGYGAILRCGTSWTWKPQAVVVDYDAGYTPTPESLKSVCAAMVGRAIQAGSAVMTDEDGDGRPVTSESEGNYSVSYSDISIDKAMAALYVSADDKTVLGPYRREGFA